MKLKQKVIKLIEELTEEITDSCTIDSEGYPNQPYISDVGVSEEYIISVIDEVNKLVGNKIKIASIFLPKTIDAIAEELTLNNVYDIEEFTEVDTIDNYTIEDKYNYQTVVFEYLKSGKFYSVTIQKTKDGEVDLGITWNGETTKKEVTVTQWM